MEKIDGRKNNKRPKKTESERVRGITAYLENYKIEKIGGIDFCRKEFKDFLNMLYLKSKKVKK